MNNQIPVLRISKDAFKNKIKDLISEGEKIIDPQRLINIGSYPFGDSIMTDIKKEYDNWNKTNEDILKYSFDSSNNEYLYEYDAICDGEMNLYKEPDYIKIINEKTNRLKGFVKRVDLIPESTANIEKSVSSSSKIKSSNNIFIVHGHNEEIKTKVAFTLTQLGLNPIILHKQPNEGKTIIEKLETNSSDVQFAVVLLTSDDEGRTKENTDLQPRARQNVILEMGLFMGKLGRKHVFILLEDGVEKPGDLDGIVYVPIDQNNAWRLQLVRELKACGYNVSADKLL